MRKMLLALSFCIAFCCLSPPQIRAFQATAPVDESLAKKLVSAIVQLEQQGSYRWATAIDVPEETRFRPGPTHGTTVTGGKTHVSMSFGSRSMHVVIDGEKAAVTNRDGRWETIWLADQGYSSQGFSASIAQGVETPTEEAKALVSSLTSLREENDVLIGTLPADVAEDRLGRRRGTESIRDVKGTVRFSIADGMLTKYVVRVEGSLVDDDQTREVWRTTTLDVSDVGTAKLELPRGASDALQRSIPRPDPRLSRAQEAALLSLRGKRDVGVHDPSSIVQCDGEYWFFSTGTGVSSWRSEDLQAWQRGPRVFPEMPTWVRDVVPSQRGHFWAPDVIQLGDRYLLYYSVSSFGKNTSAIALASSPTLNPDDPAFDWTDHGIVIRSNSKDDFNAIDPAVIRTESGELWMSFGSFWSGLKLIQLDPESGKRMDDDAELHSIASYRQIEAPHIYQHDGWFYLFVNWGKCCSGVDSTYNIRVGRSRAITGPYLDKDGVDLASGGGTLLLGSDGPFIAPGHANVLREGSRFLLSCHYYDGTERGGSRLSIQELSWSKAGWPVVAKTPDFESVSIERETETNEVLPSDSVSRAETQKNRRRLILIGDSTVKNGQGRGDGGLFGWGQMIGEYFDSEKIDVENRALGGRSSRTYLTEGLWRTSLDRLRRGDFLMIQFGHNDSGKMFEGDRPRASIKGNGDDSVDGVVEETGKTETVQSFGWYLRKYISDAKAKGAIPIVLSQVPRDRWQDNRVIRSDRDYGLWAWRAAEQSNALFIDLNEVIARRYEELGEEVVGRDLFTPTDWTHTKREGAVINAECVVDGIRSLQDCALKDFLRKDLDENQQSSWRFDFTVEPVAEGFQKVRPDDKFSPQRGYGYLDLRSAEADLTKVFAIEAEEGNYTVAIRLGDPNRPTSTTVKAEARRLMLEKVDTTPGQFVTREFTVNVRQPEIFPGRATKLNSRELGPPIHPDWDDLLTFEFGGDRPGVASLKIRPADDVVTVFLAGDSTVTDQRSEPYASWGQMLPRFFDSTVAISNHAESGLALRSFEYQHRLEKVISMMTPGDYLVIQFGHNDQKDSRPEAGAFTTYKQKLAEFVEAVRAKGGIPVLVTSMERLRMDEQGNQTPTLADYALAVRQVGTEKNVPVIDLNAMSLEFYAALGSQNATRAFALKDRTHHNSYGAYELARCVVEGIREGVPNLARHLSDNTGGFDPSEPDDPEQFDLPKSPFQSPRKPAGN